MKNQIRKKGNSVMVVMEAERLLFEKLQVPRHQENRRSHVTAGQMIQAIAYAWVNKVKPSWVEFCRVAKVSFKDGVYVVVFAKSIEDFPASES